MGVGRGLADGDLDDRTHAEIVAPAAAEPAAINARVDFDMTDGRYC